MQSLQTIKRRLKSVNSVGKITKAMELVAATKMRRAQQVALDSRPYVFTALEMLRNLERALQGQPLSPLLEKRVVVSTAYVVVASDKGLAGSFNASVFRAVDKLMSQAGSGDPTSADLRRLDLRNDPFIAVGEKAR